MKKIVQGICLFSLVLIIACKKDSTPVYDLTLSLNGATVILHQATAYLGPDTLDAGKTNFRLTAATYDSSKAITIDINKDDLNLAAGAYTSDSDDYTLNVQYFEDITGALKNYSIFTAPGKGASAYTVTITEVTGEYIKGTFSGNYLCNKYSGSNQTVDVTQGEFLALRVY